MVVVIIGILVAIAIPLYLNYRKGAENKAAESDLRGGISAAEQYYTSNGNAYFGTDTATDGPTSMTLTKTTGDGSDHHHQRRRHRRLRETAPTVATTCARGAPAVSTCSPTAAPPAAR